MKFTGAKSACGPCARRPRCLRHPEHTPHRQVVFFTGGTTRSQEKPIERMKRKFDTLVGRFIYNKRLAIVEPVFANLKNKGLARFTLRTKAKVDTQWKLFTWVHNIEKIAHCTVN